MWLASLQYEIIQLQEYLGNTAKSASACHLQIRMVIYCLTLDGSAGSPSAVCCEEPGRKGDPRKSFCVGLVHDVTQETLKLRSRLYSEYSLIFEILKAPEELWRGAMVMHHPYALRSSSVSYLTRGPAHRYGPSPLFLRGLTYCKTRWDCCFTSVSNAFLATFELVYYSLGVRLRSRLNFEF